MQSAIFPNGDEVMSFLLRITSVTVCRSVPGGVPWNADMDAVLRRAMFAHRCSACGRSYKYKKNLQRHIQVECGKEPQFACMFCSSRFRYRTHMLRHAFCKHDIVL
ncbi:hypothetical protein PR048_000166 [Dryococelus australis]|uniref:C2H2-type domain-containing protein n=1 Tax=Dryococelus australis TaxID=614101 RepID=A0ABQ9IDV6_9NEOP|nr:hypothetical protein PR048_000166 [Dryococelus australis]